MPYGVDKDLGGDSKENVSWMEKCVTKVQGTKGKDGKPLSKDAAIAICKSTMKKSKKDSKADLGVNPELSEVDFDKAELFINTLIRLV